MLGTDFHSTYTQILRKWRIKFSITTNLQTGTLLVCMNFRSDLGSPSLINLPVPTRLSPKLSSALIRPYNYKAIWWVHAMSSDSIASHLTCTSSLACPFCRLQIVSPHSHSQPPPLQNWATVRRHIVHTPYTEQHQSQKVLRRCVPLITYAPPGWSSHSTEHLGCPQLEPEMHIWYDADYLRWRQQPYQFAKTTKFLSFRGEWRVNYSPVELIVRESLECSASIPILHIPCPFWQLFLQVIRRLCLVRQLALTICRRLWPVSQLARLEVLFPPQAVLFVRWGSWLVYWGLVYALRVECRIKSFVQLAISFLSTSSRISWLLIQGCYPPI